MKFVSYKIHKKCNYLSIYRNNFLPTTRGWSDCALKAENTTYLKFTQWLTLYQADPDGWKMYDRALANATPIYDWGYITGTRRVILDDFEDGGFYGSNAFREPHAKFFEGKLWKGETVYYEIVGFTTDGNPIMPSVSNSKISDKKFTKRYGPTTVFSYGCNPDSKGTVFNYDENGEFYAGVIKFKQSDFYVYRMTMTNEDGDVVEYTPDFMRYRCEQMGAKCVPIMWKGYIPDTYNGDFENFTPGDFIKEKAEQYYDGPDPIGKTHVREGVVIRIVNRPKFCAYKHKNFSFKVLSGIAADLAAESGAADMMDEDRLAEL